MISFPLQLKHFIDDTLINQTNIKTTHQPPYTPQQSTNTVRECFFFLIQLKRKLYPKDLCLFCVTCIRPLIHYGIVSFYNSLSLYLNTNLNAQRRELSIILTDCNFHSGIKSLGFIKGIEDHHNHLCRKFFSSSVNNEDHRLRERLPAKHKSQ